MRVLWITESPSKYKSTKLGYNGRGWIESLQSALETSTEISQLGIAFSHFTDSSKLLQDKVIYYPIKKIGHKGLISRIISRWIKTDSHEKEILILNEIIKDFGPDVVHIFGTESWLCHVIKLTDVPSIVHLQGILQPIMNSYTPPGISNLDLIKSSWSKFIKGFGLWHDKKVFRIMTEREYSYFKQIQYFMGRTKWDKSISTFLSSSSTYFHVDEVLRDVFYEATPWKYIKEKKITITSTLSDSIYKGLDLIIKTAVVLVKEGFEFEWRIIGLSNESSSVLLFKKKLDIKYSDISIQFLGIRTGNEIVTLLSETTVYVHASYIDNSPNSLCEALLMGVPAISTNVGGISSLIDDSIDGFIVPPNDPYYLASRIALLSCDEAYLTKVSKRAKDRAQKRHSKESILNQLIEAYKSSIQLDVSKRS